MTPRFAVPRYPYLMALGFVALLALMMAPATVEANDYFVLCDTQTCACTICNFAYSPACVPVTACYSANGGSEICCQRPEGLVCQPNWCVAP